MYIDTKSRYSGIQDYLKWFDVGANGCYLLSLCSIAEEVTGKPSDLIGLMQYAKKSGEIFDNEQNIKDPCKILKWLTEREWTLEVKSGIPVVVKDEEYTVLKFQYKYTHFRRRGFDTLIESQTVKLGQLVACYVFTIH